MLWAKNKIGLLITKEISSEYIRVLHKIDRGGDVARRWSVFVLENSVMIEDSEVVKVCRDPDDDKFLNCAINGGADYLVSGDDDLLSLKLIGSTGIVTPSKFLNISGKK